MQNLSNVLEAILFASGDGISAADIAGKIDASVEDIEQGLKELWERYSADDRGINVIKYRNKYQFASNPTYAEEISAVLNPIKMKAVTKAVLETLAIIAYKQPITRLEIEDVRGVNCDYAVSILSQNNLIEVVGRKDSIGKPVMFGTTDEFLKRFDLENIDSLPSYADLLDKIKVIHADDERDIYHRSEYADISAAEANEDINTADESVDEVQDDEVVEILEVEIGIDLPLEDEQE